jgi:hypothetical protein
MAFFVWSDAIELFSVVEVEVETRVYIKEKRQSFRSDWRFFAIPK